MPDVLGDTTTTERRRKFRISHEEMLAAIASIINEPDIGIATLLGVEVDFGIIGTTDDLGCTVIVVQQTTRETK